MRTARGPYALKEGGLLWRLAKDHIGAKEITAWLNRPTDVSARTRHVNEDRRQEWCGTARGFHLYEDVLTPTELDMILGTCHEVYESPKNKGVIHDTIAYFWPPPNAWRTSHMNTGAWTLEAEDWYQQRLHSLRSGTAKAHTIGEWKKNLRGMKFKHKIWVNYTLLAEAGKSISYVDFTHTDRLSSPLRNRLPPFQCQCICWFGEKVSTNSFNQVNRVIASLGVFFRPIRLSLCTSCH